MNQRLSYGKVAPAVYKAMLAMQDTVDKSGLEKDLMDLVCLAFHRSMGARFASICTGEICARKVSTNSSSIC